MKALKILLLTAALCVLYPAQAQLKYLEGSDYQVLENIIDNGQAPKVITFFWFGCGHCYAAYPQIQEWLKSKPETLEYELIPAVASSFWEPAAHLYYTAVELNLGEDFVAKVFKAVQDERQYGLLQEEKTIRQYFNKEFGISEEDFNKAWNSFKVLNAVERARKLFTTAQLDGVPAFVVNGKYFVPNSANVREVLDKIEAVSSLK